MNRPRALAFAVWYELVGQHKAHAVLLHDEPFQRIAPSPARVALCGAGVPEGSPWQFDSDFHDCAACKAALAKGA